ncbi:hypothetical protein LSH36_1547g00001 [Paralvinella palmiformis]|uniref:Apple domain-containing protein n=1 Tax=Paralvinella palmiformis TaxID=53620 RepID=A0AAD9ISQ4_9ANNE|nr:hypothetical protein LSH36_1547g00001 [Paralvinella palmiformis]
MQMNASLIILIICLQSFDAGDMLHTKITYYKEMGKRPSVNSKFSYLENLPTIVECLHRCSIDHRCKTIVYYKRSGSCTLYNSSKESYEMSNAATIVGQVNNFAT